LRRAWLVLAVVFIADVMDVIDSTIANLAGPSIRADLGGRETTLQWVLSAYTAAFAVVAGCSCWGWPGSRSPRWPAGWPPASAS
jgi:MFS family permease